MRARATDSPVSWEKSESAKPSRHRMTLKSVYFV
jgi:hypothetical protein